MVLFYGYSSLSRGEVSGDWAVVVLFGQGALAGGPVGGVVMIHRRGRAAAFPVPPLAYPS